MNISPYQLPPAIQSRLTTRQAEIVQLILQGYNDEQIGHRLYITRDTIQTHKRHIRARLNLPPRIAIIRALVDLIINNK
jgi:two-component system response regulator NreC